MKTNKQTNKHAALQDSVREYTREISVAMFLQIQSNMYVIIVPFLMK